LTKQGENGRDAICFYGDTLPANIVRGRRYFVVESTPEFIRIAEGPDGPPVTFATDAGPATKLIADLFQAHLALYTPAKSHAQVGFAIGPRPFIETQNGFRNEAVASLFEDFAHDCVDECLVGFHVACRLVQDRPTLHQFFYQQEAALLLDDRRNGEMRHEAFRWLQPGPHALVRNTALVEDLAFGVKPVRGIERHDGHLGIQDAFSVAGTAGGCHEALENGAAEPGAARFRQHRHAANAAIWQQAAGAYRTAIKARDQVNTNGVHLVPFLVFWNGLFIDEDRRAHGTQVCFVVFPAGEFEREHGRFLAQSVQFGSALASASAKPV
jgi:hypothetical protein